MKYWQRWQNWFSRLHQQHPRLWLWLNIVAASTVVFWCSNWDLIISQWFQTKAEHGTMHWLLEDFPAWKFVFYNCVPWLAGLVLFGCTGLIAYTTVSRRHYLTRLYATYVLCVFLLGPGLLVNTLFKDHWGRARPVQVAQLGGTEPYTPPLYFVADGDGRSFPSGHSSVGFAFIAFWFVWRKRHPRWAKMALLGTLVFGTLVGLTRMAAGGHFLSDVMWSAWVVSFAAWVLYYHLLRIPEREKCYAH